MRRVRPPRAEDGAAAVELALVLPVLLVIVFGIVQYGFYFRSSQVGAAAARDAARYAAVGAPLACTDFRTGVTQRLAGVQDGNVVITRDYSTTTAPVAEGDDVTIAVAFDSADLKFPFLPFLRGGRVTQTFTARVEDVPDLTLGDCT